MNIDALKSFLTVAEELHFSRAAQKLRLTQPHLTRVIKKLENEVGVALFVRTKRWVELTAAGKAFKKSTEEALERINEGIAEARLQGSTKPAHLTIGFKSNSTAGPVGDFIRQFVEESPACLLRLIEGTSAHLIREVRSRRVDAAFVIGQNPSPDVRTTILQEEPIWILMPALGRSRRDKLVSVGDLLHRKWLLCTRRSNPYMFDLLKGYLLDQGVSVGLIEESPSYESTLAEVSAGLAYSFVPKSYQRHLRTDTIALPPIGRPIFVPTLLVWHRNDHRSHLQSFCEAAKKHFARSTQKRINAK